MMKWYVKKRFIKKQHGTLYRASIRAAQRGSNYAGMALFIGNSIQYKSDSMSFLEQRAKNQGYKEED